MFRSVLEDDANQSLLLNSLFFIQYIKQLGYAFLQIWTYIAYLPKVCVCVCVNYTVTFIFIFLLFSVFHTPLTSTNDTTIQIFIFRGL